MRAPGRLLTAACWRPWSRCTRSSPHSPSISETKLDGLRRHYGVVEGPATEYFALHAVRDIDHAAGARRLITRELDGADHDELVSEAERVLAANWRLLDGVENAAA